MKVILTHENSDFDALAAQLAAHKLYPDTIPVLARRLNREVEEFYETYRDQLPFVAAADLPRRRVEEAIVVDAQAVPPIKGMDSRTKWTIIDHHPKKSESQSEQSCTIAEVGAITSLLVESLRELRISLTSLEATLLLLGIYEDTGSLSYTTTTPRDLRSAAWLLEQGASLNVAAEVLRHPLDAPYRAVYSRLVDNSEWYNMHDQAILIATVEMDEYVEELSVLAHKVDEVFDPDALFLLFAFEDQVQLIARSSSKAVDVGEIARSFGGGGHGAAAAALIRDANMRDVHDRLTELLKAHVRPPVTVREIMSFGVHTLRPELSLAEAEVLMKRYGHEGFPVVERGELVGVLTRSEIDRALHHGLGETSVSAYMHTGDVSVSPNDSVATLQRVMTDNGLGQVPVVENGRVLGIVTRTDLIKLWSMGTQPARRNEIQRLLRDSLPVPLLDLLLQARDAANRMGYSLYIVGGFVRDLLLGAPTVDLDLVVEGDAIALARRLAKELRARVTSHGRFGTAKVILGGTAGTSLPASLDFVTARTEFYQHPTALPEVERSSIKQDLYRRDFTINTMAICLDGDRYGELIDFYSGERDLKDRLIRVLHNLSFVEDPTRILRAVRFEQRLGFRIETRTAELIDDALPLLDRVTGVRLRHEFDLMLQEDRPALILQRLHELGVLRRIEPGLRYDAWLKEKLFTAQQSLQRRQEPMSELDMAERAPWVEIATDIDQRQLLLALITYRLTKAQLDRFVTRLRFSQDVARYLHEVRRLRGQAWRLDKETVKPSRIYRMLHGFSPRAITAFSVAVDSPTVRDHVLLYLNRLRYVRLHVRGDFLKKEGLPQGPAYGEVLDRLLYARLDGKLKTAANEERMARKLVSAWKAKD